MSKGCGDIFRQGKDVHNSRKLRKTLVIYKTNKLVLKDKLVVCPSKLGAQKKFLIQKVAVPDVFSLIN